MEYVVDIVLKWNIRDKKKSTVFFIGPYKHVTFAARSADLIVDPDVVQRCQDKAVSKDGKYKDSKHGISLTLLAGEHVKLKFKVSSKETKGRNDTLPMMRSILCQHGWISTGISDMERGIMRYERERWAVLAKH